MFADLHLHTHFSDGTYTPVELAQQAQIHRLSTLSVTDHDTVEACTEMEAACEARGIEFITGTELTAEHEGCEVHFLGYFFDPTNAALLERLAECQVVRQKRIYEMVSRLNHLNIPIEAEAVFKLANCRAPGRPHVGRAMVQAGFCSNLDEAFDRFLKKHRPAWVPKFKMSATEAIQLVHNAGGLAVMAHPGLNRSDHLIPELASSGMDGLECYHTKHSPSTAEHYLKIADQLHLLVTGGSDCHGLSKGKPLIGTIKLPLYYIKRMKERLALRHDSAAA